MKNYLRVVAALTISTLPGMASSVYSVTDLGAFYGKAINSSGQVAGTQVLINPDGSGAPRAVLYSNGTLTNIGTGYTISSARAINDAGMVLMDTVTTNVGASIYHPSGSTPPTAPPNVTFTTLGMNNSGAVVGSLQDPGQVINGGATIATLWQNGQSFAFGALLGGANSAAAINDSGAIAGSFSVGNTGRAFLLENGNFVDLGVLESGGSSSAEAINNNGEVVGQASLSGGSSAFLHSGGTMRTLGFLGTGDLSWAFDINDSGIVVGSSRTEFGNGSIHHAFIWSNGILTDLNQLIPSELGFVLSEGKAINNSGQILAHGFVGDQLHSFLLNPDASASNAPEPSTAFLLVPVLFVLAAGHRQRKWFGYHRKNQS